MKLLRSRFVHIIALLALAAFFFALTGCEGEVKVKVKDGCVTITGIPSSIKQVTVTFEGPDEGWTKKGPVSDGKWGPYCFPRGFVGHTFNKGKIVIDTIDTSDNEKTYKNKAGIKLKSGKQEIKFDKFEES